MTTQQVKNGYGFEYAVAHAIESVSAPHGYISRDDRELPLSATRRDHLRDLEHTDPDLYQDYVERARTVAGIVPAARGPIHFAPETCNPGEVYDICYTDDGGSLVKISCKTTEVVDKKYTPASCSYPLTCTDSTLEGIGTRADVTARHAPLLSTQVRNGFIHDVTYNTPQVEKLFREHVIGTGDYYKTLPDGSVRYYPPLRDTDTLTIDTTGVSVSGKRVDVPCRVTYADGVTQDYTVSMSVSWQYLRTKGIFFTTSDTIPANCILTFIIGVHNERIIY